jgi:hypothetical protein
MSNIEENCLERSFLAYGHPYSPLKRQDVNCNTGTVRIQKHYYLFVAVHYVQT